MLEILKRWWNKPGDELEAAIDFAFEAGAKTERKACADGCRKPAKEYAVYRDHWPQRNAANECAELIDERSNVWASPWHTLLCEPAQNGEIEAGK